MACQVPLHLQLVATQNSKAYAPPVVYSQGSPHGAQPAPYGGAPSPYGAPPAPYSGAPSPYGAPPAPHSGAPSPYGAPPAPYGGAPSLYGAPPAPYGAPPAARLYGAPPINHHSPPHQPQHPPAPYPSAGPGPAGSTHGAKRALIIGCTYPRTQSELRGCINDAQCMHYLLKTKFGYPDTEVLMLRDDDIGRRDHRLMPTRANIVAGMHWLLRGAKAGDRLFFHFSGHGSQQRDRTGDEDDGMNETILPTDYKSAGQMPDDEINQRIINPLPTGARLYAVVDACHSGSSCDLPYQVSEVTGMRWASTYSKGYTRVYKGTAGGRAIQISACSDQQTAADTNAMSRSVHTGAATYSFIEAIERGGSHQSWAQLLQQMSIAIKNALGGAGGSSMQGSSLIGLLLGGGSLGGGRSQTPQLSSNEAFDLNEPIDA
eukprot:CAMPEP_0117667254 /NCGR_PEP_ID=MMETSP0804-20121206/10853_1 /TAXON_ID=1074897 /ORGANISM="Tetraselmis astigmatica, Strain CCMP880" /LENGTH=429 /DNA_ID=CAMNT_0005474937 /DNA_START=80 /DNA_END=1369 /DNA_ORIENTATION=-